MLIPVIVFIVWIGFYPGTFLGKSAQASRQIIQQIEDARSGDRMAISVPGIPPVKAEQSE